jgi:hypothetical protein
MAYRELAQAIYVAFDSPDATRERSLQEYLRALLGLLRVHRHDTPSYALFTRLLRTAFFSHPIPFEEQWLAYTHAPDPKEASAGVDYVERMLLYQIADLQLMARQGQLDDRYRNFGIASPTGNYWYNFDTPQFLECAAAGLRDRRDRPSYAGGPQWAELADALWFGQHYE